ncbi:unnamed protein product [Knipowitschia caucasica]
MTMASVSLVGQPPQPHALTQEPQLHFGVKKSLLARKTSWEKMVFRRSSVGDPGAKSPPQSTAVTPGRLEDNARQIISNNHALLKRPMEVIVANGHGTSETRGACRKSSPQTVTANGHSQSSHRGISGSSNNSSIPILERLTQGKTGVVKLARTEPHRRQAWTIFPASTGEGSRGEGHRFEAKAVRQDWCDACNCQVQTQALKCQVPSKWDPHFCLVRK